MRSGSGGPGVAGAAWSVEKVTFQRDGTSVHDVLGDLSARSLGGGQRPRQVRPTYVGWHDLVLTIDENTVTYSVDG